MGQDFRVTDLDDLACTGLIELEGKRWQFRSDVVREVVYQTLTKRVRAQRHAGVAAVMAAGGYSVDDVAQHAATAAELLVELGPVDGVKPSIIGHAIDALLEAAKSAVETGRYDTADPPRQPGARPPPRRLGDGAQAVARPRDGRAGATAIRRRHRRRRGRARIRAGRRGPRQRGPGTAPPRHDRPDAGRPGDVSRPARGGDRDLPRARGPPPAGRLAARTRLRRGVRRLAARRSRPPRRGDGDLPRHRRRARARAGRIRTSRGSPSREATSTRPRCSSPRHSSGSRSWGTTRA